METDGAKTKSWNLKSFGCADVGSIDADAAAHEFKPFITLPLPGKTRWCSRHAQTGRHRRIQRSECGQRRLPVGFHMHGAFRWLFALSLLSVLSAQAQTSALRSFAVVSEVGQQLQMVGFKEQVGTRLDSNVRTRIDTPGGALDKGALLAAQKALKATAPGAAVYLVAPLDVELFPGAGNPVVGQTLQIPADLTVALKQQGSTQLVLINRRSAEAGFQAADTKVGKGRIEGLGFYVERTTPMRNSETNETAAGFLATYVYINVSLVDLRDGRVLATKPVTDARLDIAQISAESGHPWDSVSNADKMSNLLLLLRVAVEQTVPLLITPQR